MTRLLIVDDDGAARLMAERVARTVSSDIEIALAADADAALRAASNAPFDAILVDMDLGSARGEEVTSALRGAQVTAPIILLTEADDAERIAAGIRSGAFDHIPKAALDKDRLSSALRAARRIADAEAVARSVRNEEARHSAQLAGLVEASLEITSAETLALVAEATVRAIASIFDAEGSVTLTHRGQEVSAGAHLADLAPGQVSLTVAGSPRDVGGTLSIRRAARNLDPSERLVAAHLLRVALTSASRLHLLNEARERARERQEIVAIVSHDLRTPLQSFALGLDAIDLLGGDVLRRKIAGPVARMTRSIGTMTGLLTDLLDVSRIHDTMLPVRLAPQRIGELLSEVQDEHMLLAEKKGIALTSEVEPEGLSCVCDAARLSQALDNIIANALRYTEKGSIHIRARAVPGDRARFEVTDTGPGIAPHVRARLFDRLFQGEGAQRPGSLGLGLYIVKGIALAHGGAVGVESELGRGTTFWLELPRRSTPE
jgi:signal transduction histidine kinase